MQRRWYVLCKDLDIKPASHIQALMGFTTCGPLCNFVLIFWRRIFIKKQNYGYVLVYTN